MASKSKGSGKSPAKRKAPARTSTRAADRQAANSAFPGLPPGAAKAARAKRIEQPQAPLKRDATREAAINRGAQIRMQARRPHRSIELSNKAQEDFQRDTELANQGKLGFGREQRARYVASVHAKQAAILKALAREDSPQAEARYRTNIKPEIARLDAELDVAGRELEHAAKGEKTKLREELARLAARRRERYTSLYAAELRAVQAQYAKFAKVPRRRNRERAGKMAQSYLTDALRAQDEATIAAWRHWDGLPKPFDVSSSSRADATAARARAWERVQDAVVAWAEGRGLKHERYK